MRDLDFLTNEGILLLTIEQARSIIQLSKSSMYELVNRKDCPFVVHHIGRAIRIEKASFLEWIRTTTTE